jgi:hypothetical protein
LLPAFDSGEHAFWVGGPHEGFGICVCLCDEAVDGELQINDRLEHAALEAPARELGKQPWTALSQGDEVGVKWNVLRGYRPSRPVCQDCTFV